MTIGIGAVGENAGLAVWKALNAVEKVSNGSIKGFATFTIITNTSEVKYFCTQRGGSLTLFTLGDSIADQPPEEVINAPIAAVISSGPDRLEPLELYLPAERNVGMVTGHRIPNAIGVSGKPVNVEVLELMKRGVPADMAVKKVMEENQNVDAGLIAIDVKGNCGLMNSKRVDMRPDIAKAMIFKDKTKVMVLNNEIYPVQVAADLAAAIAMQVMSKERQPDFQVEISAGVKVQYGSEDKVIIDEHNRAIEIYTTDPTILEGRVVCVVPYLGSLVVKDGNVVGRLLNEPITVLQDGVIVDLAGQKTMLRDVARIDRN